MSDFSVDIVLVIDVTGSMTPIIDTAKAKALQFYQDIKANMERIQKNIQSLRVKVIAFRDYYCDAIPMQESNFFDLPTDASLLHNFVAQLTADGGGDEPESGLEAISLAIDSNWKQGNKARHVIVLWTDASAHTLEDVSGKTKPSHYPSSMPKNLNDLTSKWGQNINLTPSAKRLILFAPDVYPWKIIGTDWDNTIHHVANAGEGLITTDYNIILETIVNSI